MKAYRVIISFITHEPVPDTEARLLQIRQVAPSSYEMTAVVAPTSTRTSHLVGS